MDRRMFWADFSQSTKIFMDRELMLHDQTVKTGIDLDLATGEAV